MRRFTSVIALLLIAVMAISLASCRTGGDGKDTTTTGSEPSPLDSTPEDSSSDDTTPSDTASGDVSSSTPDTAAPVDSSTTPEDTTTATPPESTTPKDTTTAAPAEIKWTAVNMTVYVSVENAWVRKSPDLDDASRVEVLHLRDALTCTATSESWMKVTYGGETRYIAANCVTKDDISGNDFEKVNDKVYVTATTLSLRLGPSVNTETKGYVSKGTELTRTAKSTGWSEVVVDGQTYYVSNDYISATKPQ